MTKIRRRKIRIIRIRTRIRKRIWIRRRIGSGIMRIRVRIGRRKGEL